MCVCVCVCVWVSVWGLFLNFNSILYVNVRNDLIKKKKKKNSALAFEKVDFRHLSRCEQFDGFNFDWLS